MEQRPVKSILKLHGLRFLKLKFRRLGNGSEEEVQHKIKGEVGENKENDTYRVVLEWHSEKKDEYEVEIKLEGIFSFDVDAEIDDALKEKLLRSNTFAIMMPYVRSELTLLTAQPEMESVVLQPFNIAAMMDEEE